MTGLFNNKYHVAVLKKDTNFIDKMVSIFSPFFNSKVIIKPYTDENEMFMDINVNKANNKPFDIAVVSPNDYPLCLVLKKADPNLKIMICKDEKSIQSDLNNIYLK